MTAAGAIKGAPSAAACARKWWRYLGCRREAERGSGWETWAIARAAGMSSPPRPARNPRGVAASGGRQASDKRRAPSPRLEEMTPKLLTIARKYQVFIYYVALKTNSKINLELAE